MIDSPTFVTGSGPTALAASLFITVKAEQPPAKQFLVDGYKYHLPYFQKGSRLLFQGDSITDMNWGRNQEDRNHYLGHSYVYLIAARLGVDMPQAQFDIYNRGVSGNTVAHLRERWQKDAIDMTPDLLSILVGTNDVGLGVQPEAFESDYRTFLMPAGQPILSSAWSCWTPSSCVRED